MKKILLCTAANDKYIEGILVMLYSMKKNISRFEDCHVKIFCHEELCKLSGPNRLKIKKIVPEVEFEESFSETSIALYMRDNSHIHLPSWLTIEAFRQTGFDKVIFFDVDMLCIGDISELFETDFDGLMGCGCGSQKLDKALKTRKRGRGQIHTKMGPLIFKIKLKVAQSIMLIARVVNVLSLKILKVEDYFRKISGLSTEINAGFLVLNSKTIKNGIYEDLLNIVKQPLTTRLRYTEYTNCVDQTAICKYLKDENVDSYLLPYSYNYRNLSSLASKEDLKEIKILHWATGPYASVLKPWEIKDTDSENSKPDRDYSFQLWNEIRHEMNTQHFSDC